ncbi:MAG: transcriptional regulator NrdR [Candidatus Sericytochromatia bacterium]|nr:transcriptional regulator NrdR [Candidatus Sericytochromatia bacterium]
MRCPACASPDSRVLESRLVDGEVSLRRRRECGTCRRRFTTYERVEATPLVVIKRDGSRQPFDASKLVTGLLRATVKCEVPVDRLETLALEVERVFQRRGDREVRSSEIGELVLERLWDLDEVAYVRFASVVRQFTSIADFVGELARLAEARALGETASKAAEASEEMSRDASGLVTR